MSHQKQTRRDALKTGCALAAGVAAPMFIPSTALGNSETPPPSERVTIGHIGLGRGWGLIDRAKKTNWIQSLAVADPYKGRRDGAAKQINGTAYDDFRRILDRKDIDGVIIATPDHWHVPMAVLAAQAGKDCYVEKPLGLTIEQDLYCQKVFREEKRIFQYGTQQREAEHLRFGRDLVLSGVLGDLRAIDVQAPNGGAGGSTDAAPVPAGFDYDMWLGPAPVTPYTVDRCKPKGTYWVYDQSIGYLGGWGAHPLDIMVWCYDGDQSGPYTVEGTGSIPTEGLFDTVYDWDMTLRMADGVKITFKPGSDSTKFIGTKGKLELTRNSIRAFPKDLVPDKFSDSNDGEMDRDQKREMNRVKDHARVIKHIQGFAESIRTREQTSSPIDDAVRSDVISHLCDISVRTGEKLTWDPAQQKITGGSEKALSMTSRPMRAPYNKLIS